MVHVTGNFQSESPLSPRVAGAMAEAFAQGWSDPRKISQSAAKARILLDRCISSLAEGLGVLPQNLEIIGEPNLGPYLGVAGLLTPSSTLYFSTVDRKEVHALARAHGRSYELAVDPAGLITGLPHDMAKDCVISLQAANGETGVVQNLNALVETASTARIALDYSAAGVRVALPLRWDSAFFDPQAWQGPQGIGILAISPTGTWSNPLPHLGALRTPRSFSIPLLVASALALEEWREKETGESTRLREITREFRELVSHHIPHCDIAGDVENQKTSLPHITSLSFLYVEGEELLRSLEKLGFSVDSGSACTAEDLAPSHVLAAMGLLTHGNVRITFHHDTTRDQMLGLFEALKETVGRLRGE